MGNLCYRFVIHGILLVLALLISLGQSLTCTSQKFTNKVYANCSDLPYTSAYLHWNYHSSNSSLSIAFVATPSKIDGWVAWGINPNSTGMIGCQALVAFISNGAATVKTFDITSYDLSKAGTKLSYDVSDLSAENSNGTIKILGTWKLPAKTKKVNQVWQVGPSVTQGLPDKHDMKVDNLNAKETLQLVGAPPPSTPAAPPPSTPNSPKKVNQVWQVGPSGTQGLPDKHDMKVDNLNATETLQLVGASTYSTPSSPPPSTPAAPPPFTPSAPSLQLVGASTYSTPNAPTPTAPATSPPSTPSALSPASNTTTSPTPTTPATSPPSTPSALSPASNTTTSPTPTTPKTSPPPPATTPSTPTAPSPPPPVPSGTTTGNGSTTTAGQEPIWIKIAIAIAVGMAGITVICCVIYCFLKREQLSSKVTVCCLKIDNLNAEEIMKNYGSLAPKRYIYSDVKKLTNSFTNKIGQGGYGDVYKGKLLDGRLVAVKVLSKSKGNGDEFINEVASISRTSHVNVVSLLGFCHEKTKRALIYEFMPNGSLDKFIYNTNSRLEWKTMYQIAVGVARGLEYLHRGCNTRILHFDIKPHNILLDEDLCPKISDFGLAKLCKIKESIVSMTGMRGTIGYIAPEVFSRSFGGVSHKSDVYSYGMLVLEMIGGRKNFDTGVSHTSEIYFPHWIYKKLELGENVSTYEQIIEEEEETARKMITVSLWCVQTNPSDRPSMGKVIEMLEGTLESLQFPPKPFLDSPTRSPQRSSSQ